MIWAYCPATRGDLWTVCVEFFSNGLWNGCVLHPSILKPLVFPFRPFANETRLERLQGPCTPGLGGFVDVLTTSACVRSGLRGRVHSAWAPQRLLRIELLGFMSSRAWVVLIPFRFPTQETHHPYFGMLISIAILFTWKDIHFEGISTAPFPAALQKQQNPVTTDGDQATSSSTPGRCGKALRDRGENLSRGANVLDRRVWQSHFQIFQKHQRHL